MIGKYRTGAAHLIAELPKNLKLDAFGVRSHQTLVRDEIIFPPVLSEGDALLLALTRLRREAPKVERSVEDVVDG